MHSTAVAGLIFAASMLACTSPKHLALTVNPGCEKIALLEPGATVEPHVALQELQGKTKQQRKNMHNWLQNKACELGADAVIDVVTSEGTDGSHTIYNIRGVAVRFTDVAAETSLTPAPR